MPSSPIRLSLDSVAEKELRALIQLALDEDIRSGDITTLAIYSGSELAHANIVAKENGIIAGLSVAQMVAEMVDSNIHFQFHVADGDFVNHGKLLATLSGPADSILTSERVMLNFLQRMSGIATTVKSYCDMIGHTRAKLLDTRKTVPGHRVTDKMAVVLGGGTNHRKGLYDRYLIKENHIRVAGGINKAIDACVKHRESLNDASLEIEIEVTQLEEFRIALAHPSVRFIMLDNMSIEDMAEAVRLNQKNHEQAVGSTDARPQTSKLLEASGNVSVDTVVGIAETGVDFISVGSITHSVRSMDISLLFDA